MRKIVQKAVIKVIRPQKVEYYCDKCEARLDGSNPKQTYYSMDGSGEKHVCKRKSECNPFY